MDAQAQTADALVAALIAYVYAREDIALPSLGISGQELISVPLIVAVKLAPYSAMRRQDITKTALARRPGLSECAVRKMLGPDHRYHIGQVEKALRALGHSPIIFEQ